jgi:DNA-directed RNA polymerase specialized sigma24 family protein
MASGNAGFDELLVQLRGTNALLASLLQRTFDLKQSEVIGILAEASVGASEIAQILGTSQNTVQVSLSRARQRRRHESKGMPPS